MLGLPSAWSWEMGWYKYIKAHKSKPKHKGAFLFSHFRTVKKQEKRKSLFRKLKKVFDQAEPKILSQNIFLSSEHVGLPGNIRHFLYQPCDHFSELVQILILGSLGIVNGLNQNLLIILSFYKTWGINFWPCIVLLCQLGRCQPFLNSY